MRCLSSERGSYYMDASMHVLKANVYSFIIFHLLAAMPAEQGKSMECSGLLTWVRLKGEGTCPGAHRPAPEEGEMP